jgi:hypothetical protein
MTATSQHGFHPDAESLNAFAEQALSERERGQVLAHLAVCGRCRQVVALAGEAAEAGVESEQLVAAAAAPGLRVLAARHTPRGAWWKKWRLVWVPAAVATAFAVTAISVYLVQKNPDRATVKMEVQKASPETGRTSAPPASEMAKVEPPSPPAARAVERPAKPAPLPGSSSGSARLPVPAPKPLQGRFQPAPVPAAPSPLPSPPAPAPPPAMTESVTVAQEQNGPETTSATPAGADEAVELSGAPVLFKTPAVAASSQTQQRKKADDLSRQLQAASAQNRAVAARNAEPATVYHAAAEAKTQAAASNQQVRSNDGTVAGLAALPNLHAASAAKPIRLPSGLEFVSLASGNHRLLAIDKAGNVFLSVDSGDIWQSVLRQWSGRAVLVRTKSGANGANGALAGGAAEAEGKVAGSLGSTSASATFFEIVNDNHQVWQSTDGIFWIAK